MNRTAIIADRRFMEHFPGTHHPERPERIAALIEMTNHLRRPALKLYSPRMASAAELELCHGPAYILAVEANFRTQLAATSIRIPTARPRPGRPRPLPQVACLLPLKP